MYAASLINRQAQYGVVSYDLVVKDGAGIMPTYRHAVSVPTANDLPARRNAIIAAAVAFAANDQTQASKRDRIMAMRDSIIETRTSLLAQQAALQAIVDSGVF